MSFEKFHSLLKEYVRIIAKSDGYLQSMFCLSQHGLGKTSTVTKTLEEMEIHDYVYVNSYATPVELVNILYENRNKVIVLDDVETMFTMGSKVINIFKGVLWGIGSSGIRQVSYNTTSKLLRSPTSFEFNGKLIFLVNKLPNKNDPLIGAMMSRSLVYEMKFTPKEVLEMLQEYSELPYKDLTTEERQMIYNYIAENTDGTNEELSFRTIIKMYDVYRQNKVDWKKLVEPILARNEKLMLIKKLVAEHKSKKEAQQEFCEMTGMGRATFYRGVAKIV